jgi:DNA-directed RNA polymerase specialized sigma54-like protein
MKPTLQFRLSQHLTLTPQLQQSIKLLQLSTVELNQEIERLLMENPILEREDAEGEAPGAPPAARGSLDDAPAAAPATDAPPGPREDWGAELAYSSATAAFPHRTLRACATIWWSSCLSPTWTSATAH